MDLATIPILIGPDGQPATACVTYTDGQWCVVWQTGTGKLPTGLTFSRPRAACRAAAALNERGARA
jgi:hypothetical protein